MEFRTLLLQNHFGMKRYQFLSRQTIVDLVIDDQGLRVWFNIIQDEYLRLLDLQFQLAYSLLPIH